MRSRTISITSAASRSTRAGTTSSRALTGWAQINGYRGEIDSEDKIRKRVEYDLFYIDNWSLWLDLKIIARTVLSPAAYQQRLLSALAGEGMDGDDRACGHQRRR
jgi:lipopolysaccharide/colanic/teichoic acid biosynthesis glycosyltransferase